MRMNAACKLSCTPCRCTTHPGLSHPVYRFSYRLLTFCLCASEHNRRFVGLTATPQRKQRCMGRIVDDDINKLMINKLPKGAVLNCLIDACHSGTVMDLQFVAGQAAPQQSVKSEYPLKADRLPKWALIRRMGVIHALPRATLRARARALSLSHPSCRHVFVFLVC